MSRLFSAKTIFALFLFVAIGASVSHADVIYNTFGPGDSYSGNAIGILGNASIIMPRSLIVGNAFTPTGNFLLDSIELAAGCVQGTNSLIVKLMTDSSAVPGTMLEEWTFTNIANRPGSEILIGNSIFNPLLNSGTQYWLVAFAGSSGSFLAWNNSSPTVNGPVALSYDEGTTWNIYDDQSAFRISGTPLGAPVPEPPTLLLLGSGLVGLVGFRRKFKK